MEQVSKEQRREVSAKTEAEKLPEQTVNARTNGNAKVKVSFTASDKPASAIVMVYHQGQPHPKGFSAEIMSINGAERVSGELTNQIKDSAIDFCKDKAPSLSCEFITGKNEKPADPLVPPAGSTGDTPQGAGANSDNQSAAQ